MSAAPAFQPHQPPRRREPPPIAGRLPPHDLDAEAAVLSAVLLKPDVFDEVTTILEPENFYSPANESIFRAIRALATESRRIDTVNVASWLRDREQLAQVGGPAYLAEIVDATPAIAHVAEHAKTVRRKARRRAIIAEAHLIAAEGYVDVGDEDDWIDQAEARMAKLAQGGAETSLATVGDALRAAWTATVTEMSSEAGPPAGARTGLRDLDDLFGSLRPKKVTAVGAFWGDGKSALGVQVAVATAAEKRVDGDRSASLIISVEMSSEELAQRALFMDAQVDSMKARAGRSHMITEVEWRRLHDSVARIGTLPIWLDDREDMNALDVSSSVRRCKAIAAKSGFKLRVVVVDYLQLLDGRLGLGKGANREQEVANISRAMKRIAKAEDVHVVVLAQLNDDPNKRAKGDQRPSSRDFRESKAIPQNADNVVLIYNPSSRERARQQHTKESYRPTEPEEVELIVDKHRGGQKGTVKATWYPTVTCFGDYHGGT